MTVEAQLFPPGTQLVTTMIYAMTIVMYTAESSTLILLTYLAYRYWPNVRAVRRPGPKRNWCRIFTLFLLAAFLTQVLTWCQGYIKCLDTSNALHTLIDSPEEVHRLCAIWRPISHTSKRLLFTAYLTVMFIAVCSFQMLVLERYRKVGNLFPPWASKVALPSYVSFYLPIALVAYLTSILEFWLSPGTLITRDSPLNTISSAFYCIWIVLTGLTDAVLSFLIVTKLKRGRRELRSSPTKRRRASHVSLAQEEDDSVMRKLRHLQVFFAGIVLFDCGILSLTAVKKVDGHGIHGHAFAYEVASLEIACTLVHATLTLIFMQKLGVILRPIEPRFEFVINPESTSLEFHQIPFFIASPDNLPKEQQQTTTGSTAYSLEKIKVAQVSVSAITTTTTTSISPMTLPFPTRESRGLITLDREKKKKGNDADYDDDDKDDMIIISSTEIEYSSASPSEDSEQSPRSAVIPTDPLSYPHHQERSHQPCPLHPERGGQRREEDESEIIVMLQEAMPPVRSSNIPR